MGVKRDVSYYVCIPRVFVVGNYSCIPCFLVSRKSESVGMSKVE